MEKAVIFTRDQTKPPPSRSLQIYREKKSGMMEKAVMTKKKEDKKTQGLLDLVFSWSIADVMNSNLYKNKVTQIPETFSSAEHYFNSFIFHLIEETHADLRSNMTTIYHAPSLEVVDVQESKDFDPLKRLSYKLYLKPGASKPENGDLFALAEVKPRHIDDLDRPKRPYLLAFVQGMKNEEDDHEEKDFVEVPVLSSKPIMFRTADKDNGIEGDKLFAVCLTNLITNLRIWASINPNTCGGNMKIINSVLAKNPSVECGVCSSKEDENLNDLKTGEVLNSFGLDDSQRTAVLKCIAEARCRHKNSVKLIWGPPGTGKTKTISALVCSLLGMKCRTLTCAPTNVAVLGVVKRLMGLLYGKLPYGSYGLGDIVLFGNGERLKIGDHDDLYDVFLDHRVIELAHCFAPLTGWKGSLESLITLLEDPEDQYMRYLEKLQNESEENGDCSDDDGEIEEKKEKPSKEKMSGSNQTKRGNEIPKGKSRGKSWEEIIKRDLKKQKKKDSENKKGSKKRSQSKSNEKNTEPKARKVPTIPWTFREFVTKTFNIIGDRLMLCISGLYTHMPTSFVSLEVLSNMIRALDMLQVIQSLLNNGVASDDALKLALKAIEGTSGTTNLNGMRLECLEVLKFLRANFSVPNFFDSYQIRSFCLKQACLIFCTASSSAKLHTEGMTPTELVIIDEAAQLKECESTIPLQLSGVRHAILVGDEKQLPAMVQSEICQKAGFGRSLFERLVILGHSKHLLNIQYRMHPSISLFPNREFYAKQIRDGTNVLQESYNRRFLKDKMFGTYSFINVSDGKEQLDDRHSRRNMLEVAVVAEIVSQLYKESIRSKQKVHVGCISAYKAQVAAIQERLGKTYSSDADDKFCVNIRSVDGFQGGEEDIIIISTVRCNGSGSVGFLSNSQRVNVALTRARYNLWIIGNAATLLNSGKVWKKLVMDAKSRGCFHDAFQNKNLSLAITNAVVELGKLNSLFSMDSILFKDSKWKLDFTTQFQESMKILKQPGIHEDVISLLLKLSNGWRHKDPIVGSVEEGASSQLMQSYEVKGKLRLIWIIDILQEDSQCVQVIKIWDILARNMIPKIAKELDDMVGNYTVDHMNRCLHKRIEGELTLPMSWPVNANASKSKKASHALASQLATISLGPSSGRRSRGNANKQYRRRTP